MTLPFQFSTKHLLLQKRTTQSAIDTVKQWLKTTSLPQLQEEFIVLFLLSSSNNVATAKKTVEAYFRVKNNAPEIFNGWNVESREMENILQVIGCCVVPTKIDNSAVTWAKFNDSNYRNFDLIAAIKFCCMMVHFLQMTDPADNLIVVVDMKGIGFMHLTCLKIEAVVSFLEFIQDAAPIKIKTIHILNSNYVFEKLLSLFKMFIRSEFMQSIKMHSPRMDMKEFQDKYLPASCVPKEYGGSLPPFDQMANKTVEALKKLQPFFEAEERLRYSYKVKR